MNKDYFTPLSFLLSSENMVQLKSMVGQFNDVFNEEFWDSVSRVNQLLRGKPGGTIPIEIWENKENFYLQALLAGITNTRNIKLSFKDNTTLFLKVKYPLLKPVADSLMVETEISRFVEREINLPQPVESDDYTLDLKEGVLTIILNKQNKNVDLPVEL